MAESKRNAFRDAYWKVKEEWVGDAAALFLCRLIYAERFPDLEIAQLEQRVRAATTNHALGRFAKKKGFTFGPNKLERVIAHKILTNPAEAKMLVTELVDYAEEIKALRWVQYRQDKGNGVHHNPKPFACPKCGTLNIQVRRNPTYVSCQGPDCLHAVHGNFRTPEDAIIGWNEEALRALSESSRMVSELAIVSNGTMTMTRVLDGIV